MKAANTSRSLMPMHGFTLLELMTAIAVMGILLGIGVPAFNGMIRGSQIAAETNDMVAALNLARSEALKRGVRVSVCAAEDNKKTSCSTAEPADWSNGWIVFDDDFGVVGGELSGTDTVLQVWEAPANGVTLTAEDPVVSFSRAARAEFPMKFEISKSGCTGDQKREIDVSISGRVGLKRVKCP
jgi:type IV fimbrial biogenesis protein FimT